VVIVQKTNSFKFIETFDIKEIVDHIKNFDREWFTIPELAMDRTNNPVDVLPIFKVPMYFNPMSRSTELLPAIRATRDDKLLKLVEPIIKKVESLYNSRHGRVWLAKLEAGKKIPLHIDHADSEGKERSDGFYSFAVHRVHISLITNDDVIFNVNEEIKNFKVGECWEMNNNVPHTIENNSNFDRIHLVIDILPEEWDSYGNSH